MVQPAFSRILHRSLRSQGQRRWLTKSRADAVSQSSPSNSQLRIYALHAAIPMVGFGFMDNLIMIQAGETIDLTLGVTFGLSTLTAAGFGQCFSDVAGLTCGGVVDAVVARLNLPHHHMTPAQMSMRASRIARTLGGCIGVVTGCLLGMTILLFKDTAAAERSKKAKELQSMFESIMTEGYALVDCERATLWMLDPESHQLWSRVATGTDREIRVHRAKGIVGFCVDKGKVVNVKDAYNDSRFHPTVDKATGYKTKTLLAVPIFNEKGETIGAVQMVNKRGGGHFTESDEKLARMLASHVSAFTRIVQDS